MTQQERKALWDELLALGWQPEKHYREHNVEELKSTLMYYRQTPAPTADRPLDQGILDQARFDQLREAEPDTVAGIRRSDGEEIIRIDPDGKQWIMDEVTKPGYPKPRGRIVRDYVDSGFKTVEIKDGNGSVVERYEMPGEAQTRSQVKITAPSYQVGIYRDPAVLGEFFKIHTYNGAQGFDFFDVEKYWGGRRLIPATCKRIYVSTTLCFDIESVIQAINDEYREKVLRGEIKP